MNRREELRQTAITELLQVLSLPHSDKNPLTPFPATRVVDSLIALMEELFVAKRTGLDDGPLLDPPRVRGEKRPRMLTVRDIDWLEWIFPVDQVEAITAMPERSDNHGLKSAVVTKSGRIVQVRESTEEIRRIMETGR